MRPKLALSEPLKITTIENEIVFLGAGSVNFSMTPAAAQTTFDRLGEELKALASISPMAPVSRLCRVILIVEDDVLLRTTGASALEDAGYIVLQAGDVDAALKLLETVSVIHLMFTDVQMPGDLDGLDLAQIVDGRWPTVQLLVASGMALPRPDAVPQKGRFMPKPYSMNDMLRQIQELAAA